MASFFLILNMIIVVGLLALALMSLLRGGYKNRINRLFAVFSIFTTGWIVSNFFSNNFDIPLDIAIAANNAVFFVSFVTLITFMQFIAELIGKTKFKKIANRSSVVLWAISLLSFTSFVVKDIYSQAGVYAIDFGGLFWLYALGVFYMVAVILFLLIYGLLKVRGSKNKQIKSVIIGTVVVLPLIFLLSFVVPIVTKYFVITEFGIAPMAILVVAVYYSTVRYRLFDIKLALVRTSAYILSIGVLSIVYYYLIYIISLLIFHGDATLSPVMNPINIGLVLLLALLFQPIKHFFDQVTNSVFYKASYKTEDFFAQVNKILSNTNDLRSLLERVSNEIAQTLKSEQAFFFVNVDEEHYVTAGTDDYEKIPRYDIACLSKNLNDNNVIITSLLKEDDEIRKILLTYKIEIIMPLMYNREIFGYLFLGEHLTSGYASRDIEALRAISNSLVVGIRSALIVEEIKDLNASLQERIKDATEELRHKNNQLRQIDRIKDDFVSIASHQLRTPLTGIKGYISMILEGDVGKITSRQREFLNQAFVSSEQMVRLINDFLNLSRLQSGKFVVEKQQKDLSLIVQQEIETLITSSKSRGMKLVFKQNPEKFPLVWVDEDKIRQVVMNFTDNAVYYSADNSKIYLDLTLDGNDIVFTVKDSGIGVPKKDQSRLFTKFFRADNARRQRPDGTGVGLYLAKKVIIAHKGKLIFESKLGKGSTFGFRLPNMSDGTTVSDSDNLGDN